MSYELKKIKVLGISTDFNQCECCGKSDLAKTVTILDLESGIELHFGTTCAAKADKYDTLEAFNAAKKEIRSAEYNFKETLNSAFFVAFKLLGKHYGTIGSYLDGEGVKINCPIEIWYDCYNKAVAHLTSKDINVRCSRFTYSITQ